ncbi:MAG: ABC transporter ATP-binding protein [Alphaproteobacteria bacterium]|nr:ABC transporter ATP-binding protein [Alphaproteobacteria bacterium]
MAELELIGVNKSYGRVVAVKDINLKIADNEFFCVFGPPSCGKTSILRILLGLTQPDEGEIRINGQRVNEQGPKERNLAMVFQNLALFPHMTAGENLAFPLVERKIDKTEVKRRVQAVAETLHITKLLRKLPAHLSGGERQRVAIGRALVREPTAFLMDEPIAALDARLREEMRVELKRLQRELKHTLVYVTHDQEEAMSVADRMAILEGGMIRQVGTPDEIYNHPQSRYVAELIGSPPMNFIAGTYQPQNGRFVASAVPLELDLAARADGDPCDARLAIRPEDLRIHEAGNPRAALAAEVYEVEPLGAFTIVDVNIGETILKVMEPGQPSYRLKQPIALGITPAKCHVFDGATGVLLKGAA